MQKQHQKEDAEIQINEHRKRIEMEEKEFFKRVREMSGSAQRE